MNGKNNFGPIQGSYIFKALYQEKCIVMACNVRIVPGIARGIFRAAKEMDSVVILEIAKSESNLDKGYTGMTPGEYGEQIKQAAREIGFDIWALHADHITLKKGTPEEIEQVKKLILHYIESDFTSFALDGSFLFNMNGKNVEEELKDNIRVTIELAKFIEENYGSKDFGLEVEVGEIGKKNADGLIKTTPEEAVCFIKALKKEDITPHVFGIANGSTHGNIFDKDGKPIAQVTIDIPQTIKVAKALHSAGLGVRIAQHGITGTPLDIIQDKFPHGEILKGNVGTNWMNLFWEVLEVEEPKLMAEIKQWTKETYKDAAAKKGVKSDEQLFGIYGKNAIMHFYDELHSLSTSTLKALENKAYDSAKSFFIAFKSKGSATKVREYIEQLEKDNDNGINPENDDLYDENLSDEEE